MLFGALHCCPIAGFMAAAGWHSSMLFLQASLLERTERRENGFGRRIWRGEEANEEKIRGLGSFVYSRKARILNKDH